MKALLDQEHAEGQHFYLLAGDSAYPISGYLVKPFSVAEAGRDASKRQFNERLSGLRTAMTENVYGRWKRSFQCLNHLRCHLPLAQDVILATAILHNIRIRWNAESLREEEEDDSAGDSSSDEEVVQDVELADVLREEVEAEEHLGPNGDAVPGDAARRQQGIQVRDVLLRGMPPTRRRRR